MGKWSLIKVPANFDTAKERLALLSEDEINSQWVANDSPRMEQFGLSWYTGISGDGWACIDDSASTSVFRIFVPRDDFIKCRSKADYWEKFACLLAIEMLKDTNV